MTAPKHFSSEEEHLVREIHSALDFLEERIKRSAFLELAGMPEAIALVIELRRRIIAACPASARGEKGADEKAPTENPANH